MGFGSGIWTTNPRGGRRVCYALHHQGLNLCVRKEIILWLKNYCEKVNASFCSNLVQPLFKIQLHVFPVHTFTLAGTGILFIFLFVCLFGVLRRFQHCTGHITTGSWKGRGNQYIQFVRVLYCKLPTNGKQLPAFPLEAVPGIEPRPQRWEAQV